MKVKAYIHSLKGQVNDCHVLDEAEIIRQISDNLYLAEVNGVVKKNQTLVSGDAYDVNKNTDVVLTISQPNRGYTIAVTNATKADATGIIPYTVKVTDADVTVDVTITKRDEKTARDLTVMLKTAGDWADANDWVVKVQGENDPGVEYVKKDGGPDGALVVGATETKILKGIYPGETVTILKGTIDDLMTVTTDCTVIGVEPVVVGKDVTAAFGTKTASYTGETVYAAPGTAVKVSTAKAGCVVVDAPGTDMEDPGVAVNPPVGTVTNLNADNDGDKASKVISYILPGTHVHVAGAA